MVIDGLLLTVTRKIGDFTVDLNLWVWRARQESMLLMLTRFLFHNRTQLARVIMTDFGRIPFITVNPHLA